ncbi:MAG: cyclase family protein [Flavobacteriales bacterium]|nr:cyclase family protein [Flavobacteriales bacterium]
MIATIDHNGKTIRVDLNKPLDISIPFSPDGPRAWYVDKMKISPVVNQHFTGSVRLGGAVNFRNISFNPHGHGTHTESFGHISPKVESVNDCVKDFFFMAKLITITPEKNDSNDGWIKTGDLIITKEQIAFALGNDQPEALVIRTMPNELSKRNKNYSDTNFAYFAPDALRHLAEKKMQHLLVDLPSVDRESDGGKLLAHHAFWNYPQNPRTECSITEFVFVPDEIPDGNYLLNLQFAPFENDASPSRPVLFGIL